MTDDLRLSRMTLADRLFEQLRQQIIAGRIAVGATIPAEQEIGEAFGVGRTTVREALHGLVSAGFVERRGRTLVVRDPNAIDELTLDLAVFSSRSSIQQLYDARKLLEVEAARLAAGRRTLDDLEHLRHRLGQLDTDDLEQYHAADPEFHTAIVQASGNDVLYHLYLSARPVFFKRSAFWRVFPRSTSDAEGAPSARIGSGYAGHQAIFESIEAGDAGLAGALMASHLDRVRDGLLAGLDARSPAADHGARGEHTRSN